MVQTFTALPTQGSDRILCYYSNTTQHLQIVCITDIPGWRFERLIFPGQRLLFEAIPDALFKVYSGTIGSTAPVQQIPCTQLQVQDKTSDLVF